MRAEALHGGELSFRGILGETPDEDHEDRDQGDHEEGNEGGPGVEEGHDEEGEWCGRRCEDELREELDEVGTEVIKTTGEEGCGL